MGGSARSWRSRPQPDLISFSGGFPDPATFPGPVLAEILGKLIAAGDASAMQYAPTPGLPGPRAFIASDSSAVLPQGGSPNSSTPSPTIRTLPG